MADFTLMCRVCMSQNKNLTNIFSSASGFSQIYTVVMECAPIQIAPGDNLPSFICEQCINNLDVAYRFRGQCVQTDVLLRQCLNQICDVKDEPDCDDNKDELPEEPKPKIDSPVEPSASNEERNNKSVMPFGLCEIIMANDLLKGTDTKVESKRVKKEKSKPSKIENEVKKTGKKKRIRARPGPKREKFDYSGIKERTDGRWQCDLCENHYKSKYHLKRHKISHIPELSTIRCELCGKTFTRNAHLKMHRGTHTGEKSCSCELCGKTFYSVNSLAAHRRIHLGLKPYKCKFCPKAFTQNKTLQNHTRTHTGERPFVCETCGKSFNRNHHLTTHKTIHTNEKNNSANRSAARAGFGEIKISPTMNAVHEQKMKLSHTNFISHNDEVYQSLHLDQKKDLF